MTVVRRSSIVAAILAVAISALLAMSSTGQSATRASSPGKVTQIDILALKRLLHPNGKPRLINFWATWCDPCREEYPDLVKLDQEYRGKIDFLTVSLDDLSDKDTA